jgi:hypothetical protein
MLFTFAEEKIPTRYSPGDTMLEAADFPAAVPAGPTATLTGVRNSLLYPISVATPATGAMPSLVRVTEMTTCAPGLPEAVPRSTVGVACAAPARKRDKSTANIVILP